MLVIFENEVFYVDFMEHNDHVDLMLFHFFVNNVLPFTIDSNSITLSINKKFVKIHAKYYFMEKVRTIDEKIIQ